MVCKLCKDDLEKGILKKPEEVRDLFLIGQTSKKKLAVYACPIHDPNIYDLKGKSTS